VSFPNQNPVRVFPAVHEQKSNVQRSTSNIELQKNCFAGDEIFCHLRSTWTADSRSTGGLAPLFHSHYLHRLYMAGRRKISKISHWWPKNSLVGCARFVDRCGESCRHFFGTPGEAFTYGTTLFAAGARYTIIARILSLHFYQAVLRLQCYSIYEYLRPLRRPNEERGFAVFLFTRLLASGTRLYVAAIALALAYEMIRGVQPVKGTLSFTSVNRCHRHF